MDDTGFDPCARAPAEHGVQSRMQRSQERPPMAREPRVELRLQDDVPLLAEMPHARAVPGVAPPQQIERQIRRLQRARSDVADHGGRLNVHGSAELPHRQTQVDVFVRAQQPFVESAGALERLDAYQHAMKLDDVDRPAAQWLADRGERRVGKEVRLAEHAAAVAFLDFDPSAGHVNDAARQFTHQVERTDDVGAGFRGAPQQRLQPAVRDEDVVVDEYDKGCRDVPQADVARLVRREQVVLAYQPEAAAARLLLEVALDVRRRTA